MCALTDDHFVDDVNVRRRIKSFHRLAVFDVSLRLTMVEEGHHHHAEQHAPEPKQHCQRELTYLRKSI